VLAAAESTPDTAMGAYVVLSLLTGARTEEVRALRWDHVVAYDDFRQAWIPVSVAGWNHERFAIYLWRSARAGGDTKTKKSRRTLALPRRCVVALRGHYDAAPAEACQRSALLFTRSDGEPLDRHTALRAFRKVVRAAGLLPGEWVPRELRHSFVSLLSDDGMPLENIARLVGHVDTMTTETVYRKQIRPVVLDAPRQWTASSPRTRAHSHPVRHSRAASCDHRRGP
jgi:integrase